MCISAHSIRYAALPLILIGLSSCSAPSQYAGVDCTSLEKLEEQTLCDQSQKAGLGQKSAMGAATGAIGGAFVGAIVGKLTGKDPKKTMGYGAASGLAAGGLLGAGDAYIDQKIGNSVTALAQKVDVSLEDIRSEIDALEQGVAENNQTIHANSSHIDQLERAQSYTKRDVLSLTRRLVETEERGQATSTSIQSIDDRIKILSIEQAKSGIANEDLTTALLKNREELTQQSQKLSGQKKIIRALLNVINEDDPRVG